MQGYGDQLHPVAFCSRTLTQTEVKYAQTEKECLAVVWTCERLSHYLVGLSTFKLVTDHKPLVPLINQRDLDKTPLRCQRLLMPLMWFNPQAEHVPGKQMVMADTLSRSPLKLEEEPDTVEDVQAFVDLVESTGPATDNQLERVREASAKDPQLQNMIAFTLQGWPRSPPRYESSLMKISSGLLTSDDRIVVPVDMREEILECIHTGHQGITKCRECANLSVGWPGISKRSRQRWSHASSVSNTNHLRGKNH